MSEKRYYIFRYYIFLDDVWCIRDRTNKRNTYKVGKNKGFALMLCDLLNEQQSLITALEKEHKRAENQIKLLNKQLSKIPPNIRKVWLYD